MEEKPTLFIRKASGLIREIGPFSALAISLGSLGAGGVLWYIVMSVGLYPGVNLWMTPIVGFFFFIPVAIVYIFMSSAMPRTGGNYIWTSRLLHPALGFMQNFVNTLIVLSFIGSISMWGVSWGAGVLCWDVGLVTGTAFWASLANVFLNPVTNFAITVVAIIAFSTASLIGTKHSIRVMIGAFLLTYLGSAIFMGVLATTGPAVFTANFNRLSGTTTTAVQQAALSGGWPLPTLTTYTLSAFFLGSVYGILSYVGFENPTYMAGEVRNVRKTITIGLLGAIGLDVIFGTAINWLAYYGFGAENVNALTYLWITGSSSYPFSGSFNPALNMLVAFSTQNLILLVLISVGFIAGCFACGFGSMLIAIRNVFAWSFDRILPTKMADVNKRFRTPHWSILLVAVASIIYAYIANFTGILSLLTYSMLGSFAVLILLGLTAAVFPYRGKSIFEASPPFVKKKIGSVPVISIVGVIVIIAAAFASYAVMEPAYIGVISPTYIEAFIALWIIGLVIYAVSYYYNKAKGVPIGLAHREIPPE